MHRRTISLFILTVFAAVCVSAAGKCFPPVYEQRTTDEGSFLAIRPFYSHTVTGEGEIRDIFWPLYSRKSFKDEKTSRALIFYYTHRFNTDQESIRKRRWLLPFFFQGRDVNGKTYGALFPIGGTIHEFLGRDRLSFFLFPLVGTGQINDVKTTNVLWPIYSRTRGEGIRRDRVFPLVGKSTREGCYEKKFMAWPLWTSAEYFHPGDSGKTWILFPFCGWGSLENEKTLWLLPPFFRFTKGTKQNRTYCPWPFYQKIESERVDTLWLWPLWGHTQQKGGLNHRTFVLWPFLWSERSESASHQQTRRMALPFFSTGKTCLKEDGIPTDELETVSSYWRLWPLMSWEKDEQASRFRLLELWPVRNSVPVERNWAPLWTLYKRTDRDGTICKDLLWFAWHSEKAPKKDRSEWSLLKGLVSYKKEGSSKCVRLLYFLGFGE